MQNIEPAMFEDLFEDRLHQYDEEKNELKVEAGRQEDLLTEIKQANTAFVDARKGDNSTREREQALQRLENGYSKYKEIVGNVKTGRDFYNDLAKMVTRFRDQCKDFAYQRRLEAGQLEGELADAMSALNLSRTNSLQDEKQRENLRNQYKARTAAAATATPKQQQEPPLAAPIPTRVNVQPPPAASAPTPGLWSPGIGISFGAPAPNNQQQQQAAQQPNGNATYPDPKARGGQWDAGKGVRFG